MTRNHYFPRKRIIHWGLSPGDPAIRRSVFDFSFRTQGTQPHISGLSSYRYFTPPRVEVPCSTAILVRFIHLQLCKGGRVHSRDGNPAEYTTVGEWLHRLDWGGYGRLYILALSSPTTKIIFWCLKSRFSPMSPRHRPAGSRGRKRVHSLPLHSLEDFQHVAQGCLFSQRMNNKS